MNPIQALVRGVRAVLLILVPVVAAAAEAQEVHVHSTSIPNDRMVAGEPTTVTIRFDCVGPLPTTAVVDFWLSNDGALSGDDLPLGSAQLFFPNTPIIPVWSITHHLTVVPPVTLEAQYHWFFVRIADVAPADPIPGNNVAWHRVLGVGRPDLEITTHDEVPSAITSGSLVTVRATVGNIGQGGSSPTVVSVYLVDQAFEPQGRLLGTLPVPALALGASTPIVRTFRIPADWPTGQSLILLWVDQQGAIPELNDVNNRLFLGPMNCTALPDLEPFEVLVVAGSVTSFEPVTLMVRYRNLGRAPAPYCLGRIQLSGWFVTDFLVEEVPPLGTRNVLVETVLPQIIPVGGTLLGATLDWPNQVFEGRETNNVASVLVTSNGLAPDLRIDVFQADSAWMPGAPITPTVVVRNSGTTATPGGLRCGLFLSSDQQITPADMPVMDFALPALAPNGTYVFTAPVPAPVALPFGEVFVGVMLDVDDAVLEFGEGNNVAAAPITCHGTPWAVTLLQTQFDNRPCGPRPARIGSFVHVLTEHTANVVIRLEHGVPNGIAFLVMGSRLLPHPVPLPGFGCDLLVEPLVVGSPAFLPMSGGYQRVLPVSAVGFQAIGGSTISWQFVGIDLYSGGFWSSDALEMSVLST